MRTFHATTIMVAAVAGLALTGCLRNPAAGRAAVEAGHLREARASWWGFDANDSTACLQAAIDSGVRKLVVDRQASDWIVGPIKVASDIEVVFEDRVVIRSKKGAFGKNDRLFDIENRKNVVMRGQGRVVFMMDQASTYPHDHEPGQRHTIRIFSSRNIRIENLTVRSSGGDGVYVGYSPQAWTAENIVIARVISENHPRQAISVTGAKNLLLKDCVFNNTHGVAPQCGIDIEPNYAAGGIVNFVAENCAFNGNAFAGIIVSLSTLNETSEPVSIRFQNCQVWSNETGIAVYNTGSGTPPLPGRIEFIDCKIGGTTNNSLSVSQHRVTNMAVVFRGLTIDNRGSAFEGVRLSSSRPENLCGLVLKNITVIDDADRPPMRFISRFGNGLAGAVVQNVKTVRSDGTEIVFDTEAFLTASAPDPVAQAFRTLAIESARLRPVSEHGTAAGGKIRCRGRNVYFHYARAGQAIQMRFTNKPVHRYESRVYRDPLEVTVFNPVGMKVGTFGIPYDETFNYTLQAGEPGVYRFEVDARTQTVSVETEAPGQGWAAAENLYLFGCSGRLYFQVPAGVAAIRIEAGGAPREASTVHLLDPDGNPVDAGINLEGSQILKADRSDASKTEVWSIRFSASKLWLRLGAPLIPVLSTAPENLLVPVPET